MSPHVEFFLRFLFDVLFWVSVLALVLLLLGWVWRWLGRLARRAGK